MLKKTFARLRRQPKHIRDAVAFWTAGGFVCLVFAVWIFTAPSRFSDLMTTNQTDTSPVKTLFSELGDQMANVNDALPSSEDVEAAVQNDGAQSNTGNESLDTLVETFRDKKRAQLMSTSSLMSDESIASTTLSATTSVQIQTGADSAVAEETPVAPKPVRIIAVPATTTATTSGR